MAAAAAPNVKLSFGPMLLGVFLNMILYGILLVQMQSYFKTYRKDSLIMKAFIGYLFIVETANTAMDMYMMYEPLILKFGLQDAVVNFPTLFIAQPLVVVLVSTPIQLFFSWRIYKITQRLWIPAVICLFSISALAGGIWTTITVGIIKLFALKPKLHNPALLWFLSASVADICITVALVISLSRRKTGFSATDTMIDKIIRMTVQTGGVTAFFAVADVIFFMSLPHTAVNFIWDIALSKLYSNCLLSTLNARSTLMPGTGAPSSSSHRNIVFAEGLMSPSSSARRTNHDSMATPQSPNNIYELETKSKSMTDSGGIATYASRDTDLEYGITVTKVVERVVEDPDPLESRWK